MKSSVRLGVEELEARENPAVTLVWSCPASYGETRYDAPGPYNGSWWQDAGFGPGGVPVAGTNLVLPAGGAPCKFTHLVPGNPDLTSFGSLDVENGQSNTFAAASTVSGLFTLGGGSYVRLAGNLTLGGGYAINGGGVVDGNLGYWVDGATGAGGSWSGTTALGVSAFYTRGLTTFAGGTQIKYDSVTTENCTIVNWGTARVVNGSTVAIDTRFTNDSGVVQLGDSVTSAGPSVTFNSGLSNVDSGEVDVISGTCYVNTTYASVATGYAPHPNCALFNSGVFSEVQVATDATLNVYVAGLYDDAGTVNSMYDGRTSMATINGDVWVNGGVLSADIAGGGVAFTGTGGAASGMTVSGILRFVGGSNTMEFNADFTVPGGMVSHFSASAVVFSSSCYFTAMNVTGTPPTPPYGGTIAWAVLTDGGTSGTGAGPGGSTMGAPFAGAYAAPDGLSYGVYVGLFPFRDTGNGEGG